MMMLFYDTRFGGYVYLNLIGPKHRLPAILEWLRAYRGLESVRKAGDLSDEEEAENR